LRSIPYRVASLLILGAAGTSAPAIQAQRPARPDTASLPLASPAAPGYLATFSRLDNAAQLFDGTYRVIVAAAPTANQLDRDASLGAGAPVCHGLPRVESPASTETDHLVARNAPDLLVVVATSAFVGRDECEDSWDATVAATWHASFYADSARRLRTTPEALALEVDGRRVDPVAAVSRPAMAWNGDRWIPAGTQLRYYYDMRLIAIRADGAAHRLTVLVWGTDGASPAVLRVPEYNRGRMADEYLVWHFAGRDEMPAIALSLHPRQQVSDAVGAALASASDSRPVRAAIDAATYLTTGADTDSSYDATVARALIAGVAHTQSDSALAVAVLSTARRAHSCLRLPAGSPPALALRAEAMTEGRCEPSALLHVGLAGLMIPGGGHYVADAPDAGHFATAVVAATGLSALIRELNARSSYTRYQSATSAADASLQFRTATDARAQARAMAWTAVAAWLADDAIAITRAPFRNRSIDRERL
jgi:hypothetical protein